MSTASEPDRSQALLAKVRGFVETLDPDERELFAVLIGPGVKALVSGPQAGGEGRVDDDDEVTGFQHGSWSPGSLRAELADAVQNSEWRIVDPR